MSTTPASRHAPTTCACRLSPQMRFMRACAHAWQHAASRRLSQTHHEGDSVRVASHHFAESDGFWHGSKVFFDSPCHAEECSSIGRTLNPLVGQRGLRESRLRYDCGFVYENADAHDTKTRGAGV